MYFILFFEIVICFSHPKFCSVPKDDMISEYVFQVIEFNQDSVEDFNKKYFSFQCLKALFDPLNCPCSVPSSWWWPIHCFSPEAPVQCFFCWWNLLCINFGGNAGECIGWEGDKSSDKSGLREFPDCLIRAPSLNHCHPGAVQPNLIGLRDCLSTLVLQRSTVNSFCPSWCFFDTHFFVWFF